MRKIICNVKGLKIGGENAITIQSMCNIDTCDTNACINQCRELHLAGAQLIRLTTQGLKEVESLGKIKKLLHKDNIYTPLVADVHFSSDVAIAAARVADKVRINPGNFSKNHEDAMNKFGELIKVCREYGTALRIGINHGSLGERITSLYGNNSQAMATAAAEWLKECIKHDFMNVVISLKSSNTKVMIDAYRALFKIMSEDMGMIFPMHLGVTEAGNGYSGRIKSAVGIGTLLSEGIGDTIRVSLTENPVKEIPVAALLAKLGEESRAIRKEKEDADTIFIKAANYEEFIVKASYMAAPALIDGIKDDISISGEINGNPIPQKEIDEFKNDLMQACRRRFTKPEYIACPGCGRTLYDIEKVLSQVKLRTSHLKGLRIAVMGCIVNGPGEMADADYGYVGEGKGKVTLYKGKTPVMRAVPQEIAIDKLLEIIELHTPDK